MRIKFCQKIIDRLRGKKANPMQPPCPAVVSKESKLTDNFEAKLKHLIRLCAAYKYPETKNDYVPDFSKPVLLELNPHVKEESYQQALNYLKNLDLKALDQTYKWLSDEYSKELMLQVIAYKCFEEPRLRFPVFYSEELFMSDFISSCAIDNKELPIWRGMVKLKKYDLSKIGFNITLWQNPMGSIIDFVREQYRYRHIVETEEGDCVIDAGACWGDTAVYFSEKNKGAPVYSFEFLPENVGVFNKNVELNPQYKDNIKLIQRPISDVSGVKLYAVPNGPGTSITSQKRDNALEFETITIDDYVEQNNIQKIDFIKMDIEGSEEAALKGAVKTIKKHKPKLAICVYHKKDDLCVLPQLLKSLVPEYKFYLNHHTINFTETVLYAKV